MDPSPECACIEPSGSSAVTMGPRIVSGFFPVCGFLENLGHIREGGDRDRARD